MNNALKKLRRRVYKYYLNNFEISGYKGLVHDLAFLEIFTEETVSTVCSTYGIDIEYLYEISNFNLVIESQLF